MIVQKNALSKNVVLGDLKKGVYVPFAAQIEPDDVKRQAVRHIALWFISILSYNKELFNQISRNCGTKNEG